MSHAKTTYTITQASGLTGVKPDTLRKWEKLYPQLKPQRQKTSNHRKYTEDDINIIRRIKELQQNDHYKTKGARRQLSQELHGQGAPKTNHQIQQLIQQIQDEIRTIIDICQQPTTPNKTTNTNQS